ncbi:hypothetical protein SAMN04515647_3049 [Cohaesibacter sp. ES.047]|uniref:DUF5330 domain-containing protein n=1 Tax=Cohaesibacter sp. ES.047 TaxID=1798205 RepID=UPI000BC050A5|nr:DUF5330 domain-containing protein [Cohaesibacter sp. ES.047]SNY92781.1 hypothetical protein SAMN04515647_3049 [Cohaesibacter sp. ES.047]
MRLSATQAITAAQATLSDFTSFCSRQPDVCAAGEVALENFTAKARYGAKQLYVYLDGEEATPETTDVADATEATGLIQAPGFSDDQGLERQELSQLVNDLQ